MIWVLIFAFIITISFLLAWRSMKDYQENPGDLPLSYSLYLIKNPLTITEQLFNYLIKTTTSEGLIISLEILFKGQRNAFVIYGPTLVMEKMNDDLGLVELENYIPSQSIIEEDGLQLVGFNITSKPNKDFKIPFENINKIGKNLLDKEQSWWQITLKIHKRDLLTKISGLFNPHQNKDLLIGEIRNIWLISQKKPKSEAENRLNEALQDMNLTISPNSFESVKVLQEYSQRLVASNSFGKTIYFNPKKVFEAIKVN